MGTGQGVRDAKKLCIRITPIEKKVMDSKKQKNILEVVAEIPVCIRILWSEVTWGMSSKVSLERKFL